MCLIKKPPRLTVCISAAGHWSWQQEVQMDREEYEAYKHRWETRDGRLDAELLDLCMDWRDVEIDDYGADVEDFYLVDEEEL